MTVRARLTLWYSGLLVLIVGAFAFAAYVYLDRLEHRRIDQTLHEQSEIVEQAMGQSRNGTFDSLARGRLLPALHELRARGIRVWILDDAGALRVSSSDVPEGEGPEEEQAVLGDTLSLELLRQHARNHSRAFAEVPAGRYGARLLTASLAPELGGGTLLMSYPLRDVAALLARAKLDAAVAIIAALVLSLGAGYILAREAMAPVAAMSSQAARIGASNLHERVPVHNPADELGVLATTFNALLDRLAQALAQQRRFMADASHELRTPVAILRGETDVVLRSEQRSSSEYREALRVVQAAAERLGHTVNDIFLLALVDATEAHTNATAIYLNDLVIEGCRAMRSLADRRGIAIECSASVEAAYVGDEQLLQRLIANLVDNAIKYSATAGRIEVQFVRVNDEYVLDVSNGGPGIPPQARAHVFDRFYRADAARTITLDDEHRIAGSGLGLPIARWIAERHGGTLELTETTEARTTFTVRLPFEPVLERAH